jgi:hypothetical protein
VRRCPCQTIPLRPFGSWFAQPPKPNPGLLIKAPKEPCHRHPTPSPSHITRSEQSSACNAACSPKAGGISLKMSAKTRCSTSGTCNGQPESSWPRWKTSLANLVAHSASFPPTGQNVGSGAMVTDAPSTAAVFPPTATKLQPIGAEGLLGQRAPRPRCFSLTCFLLRLCLKKRCLRNWRSRHVKLCWQGRFELKQKRFRANPACRVGTPAPAQLPPAWHAAMQTFWHR